MSGTGLGHAELSEQERSGPTQVGYPIGWLRSISSIAKRFPLSGKRHRAQWLIYNLFMRKASQTENIESIAPATPEPEFAPMPPILPVKREWRAAVLEAASGNAEMSAHG